MVLELNWFYTPIIPRSYSCFFKWLFLSEKAKQHEEEEEDGGHYITLFDALSIWDLAGFIAYPEFENEVVV